MIFSFQVGVSGVGYIWSVCEGGLEEEWRHSVAPIPANKLLEFRKDPIEPDTPKPDTLPTSGTRPDEDTSESEDVDLKDDACDFEKEVWG